MPNQKLQDYISFRANPSLAAFQNFQDLKERLERRLQEIEQKIEQIVDKAIKEAKAEIKQIEPSPFKMKTVEKLTRNILKDIKGEQGIQGDSGYSPVKGKDYFTATEIEEITTRIQSLIRLPEDGKTPTPGKDYPTKEQIEKMIRQFISEMEIQLPKPENGKTPRKGIDYFTEQDIKQIVRMVETEIGKQLKDEFEKIRKEMAALIKNLPKPVQLAGTRTLHRGGTAFALSESLGTGDGSTTTFTLSYMPYDASSLPFLFVGGGIQFETDDWTRSGKTIEFLIAPPDGAKVRAPIYRKV